MNTSTNKEKLISSDCKVYDGFFRTILTSISMDLNFFRGLKNDRRTSSDAAEVDERLKNIEPKMVELITNEVSTFTAR